jgi:hypothetical protein
MDFRYHITRMKGNAVKKPPPISRQPERKLAVLSPIEAWYLKAFTALSVFHKRSPTMLEMSQYTDRAQNSCYVALRSIASKGHLDRIDRPDNMRGGAKNKIFVLPGSKR